MASVQQLCSPVEGIACHSWNGDKSQVALCPNNNEIHIYNTRDWSKAYTLTNHDLLVSSIDWCPINNKIVSCSHDRNAYVWSFEPQCLQDNPIPGQPKIVVPAQWKPSPVILRIDRAAFDVKWSNDGKRFAVASGSKCVPLCTYEPQNDWWISKMIKKKFKSTVTCVAFHPTNGQLLATGSTDFKCRVYSTFASDVDDTVNPGAFGQPLEFGEAYAELPCLGWVNSVAWSPSGNVLAYCGQDSTIHFATFSTGAPVVRSIKLKDMPLNRLLFVGERAIVGAGHDFNPFLFTQSGGEWNYSRRLDQQKEETQASVATGGVAAARALFQNKTTRGQDQKANNDTLWTKHENAITAVNVCSSGKNITKISTSALDGRLVIWDLPSLEIDMGLLSI